jgi:transcriptional regulator with XRE-family HTH domain
LAVLAGIPQPRISSYERGAVEPSLDSLARLGSALHAHVLFQRQHPAASWDEKLRDEHARGLATMGEALESFLIARSEYADLALPLVELLRTAQASLTASDPQ